MKEFMILNQILSSKIKVHNIHDYNFVLIPQENVFLRKRS